jgi:hypothetical protein
MHEEILQTLKKKNLEEVWRALYRHFELSTMGDQVPWGAVFRALTLT